MRFKKCPKCHSHNPPDSLYCRKCASPLSPAEEIISTQTKTFFKPAKDLRRGKIVAEKYKIIRKIGEGGMGTVYEALDIRLKRTIALKFLSPELTHDSEIKQRFIREAQAASMLDHHNICTIHEIDEDESHRLFIAMAFCPGQSLKAMITPGPVPLSQALEIAIQLTQGLTRAHEEGIIHRDIKPGNIMVTDRGEVKIVDFGLAKVAESTAVTQSGTFLGTAAYMSPEQIQEESLDIRTDIWAVGVVLYEMTTGSRPFRGENYQAVIHSILHKAPPLPADLRSDIPSELEMVILKCLSKEKNYRYSSTEQLLSELKKLRRILEGEEFEGRVDLKKRPEAKKETEMRKATVMFVEISGLLKLLENTEQQDSPSVISRCRELLSFMEEKYEGKVDKITESSYRILFGVPRAVENASHKAVNSAIELTGKFEEFNRIERVTVPINVHIGINSGTVIVRPSDEEGKAAYAVLGDAVNFALQLKDAAAAGKICVGHHIYKETRREFDYKTLKPLSVKGQEQPVPVFELISKKARISPLRAVPERMISSELVGREEELDKLWFHLLKAINGEGSIVNVIGEAGIGKSRLIAEFREKTIAKKVTLLEGRVLYIGKTLSFHPIIDLIRNWTGIKEEDSPLAAHQKLEKAIKRIDPERAEEIFPFIATLMSMKLSAKFAERVRGIEGEALEKLILKSVRELIEKAAEQRTLVFIMEDLHWADLSSLELLESLYRLAENRRILFLNSFRPYYEETSGRLREAIKLRYGHISAEILLKPLNANESQVLIHNLLRTRTFPAKIRDLITERAGGNPFFIEEVARSFIDNGIVEVKDGRFRVTDKINFVFIPETIQEILMARIDKLDEETKSLLKVAAAIGKHFFFRILSRVAGDIEAIEGKLEHLKGVQLIQEQRSQDEIEYMFKHTLVQEVAYESIMLGKRKELHLKIAAAIESLFSEKLHEFYGMLAFHYSKGEDLDKAEEFLIKAGEEALRSSASNEALHFYQEALTIYTRKHGKAVDPEKIAMLQKNIAVAFFNRGQLIEAIDYFDKVMAFHGLKSPRRALAIAFKFSRGFLNFLVGVYFPFLKFKKPPSPTDLEIIDMFQRKTSALSVAIPKRMFLESFYFSRLVVNFDLTKVQDSIGTLALYSTVLCWPAISFRLSRKILEFVKDKQHLGQAKSILYFVFARLVHDFFTGNWQEIAEFDEHLVESSLKIGEFFFTINYLAFLCHVKIQQGNLEGAREIIDKVEEISLVFEHDYARTQKYYLKAMWLLKQNMLEEALKEAEEGISFAQKTGYIPQLFSLKAFRAQIQVLLGDNQGAEETLEGLVKIRSEENVVPLYLNYNLRSWFLLDLFRMEKAKESGSRADLARARKKALKSGQKMIRTSRKLASERTENFKWMGLCYWLAGKQKRAVKWWEKSFKEGRNLEAALELAKAYAIVGKKLSEEKSPYREIFGVNAQRYLQMAKSMIEDLDLQESLNLWSE